MPSKDDEWIKKKKKKTQSKHQSVGCLVWLLGTIDESNACFECSEEHVCLYFLSVVRNRDI